MTTTAATAEELDSAAEVLRFAREQRAVVEAGEAALLRAAATWAEQHPVESIEQAALVPGGDHGLAIAGPGAPLVAEFCIAEFAAAIGRSTDSGRALIGAAVELKYRLPKLWARTHDGDLAAWRARRVADLTLGLCREAAAFVDAQVAPFVHRIGPAALERLVAEAVARFMPEQALADAERAAESRFFRVEHERVSFDGISRIEGALDFADALDLEDALSRGAASLAAAGCQESLDVRRSMAAGELARRQLALDLSAAETDAAPSSGAEPRQVVLFVHLSEQAIAGVGSDLHLARVEHHRQVVTADQVRRWCGTPGTSVVVRPVIDADQHVRVDSYEVPDRLREQTGLRDGSCVFPWCSRQARRCDCDHVVPYESGGTTCSCNLAPLCRRHHRLKTHSTWTYTALDPGTFLWSSPHGYQFVVDPTGTADVTRVSPRSSGASCFHSGPASAAGATDPPEH